MDNVKRIAAVDSIDNGVIGCTVSIESRRTSIQGSFAEVKSNGQTWLVRIRSVSLTNPIHSNDKFAPLIMAKGAIAEWSAHTDIEKAEAEVISVISNDGGFVARNHNCSSGTPVMEITDESVERFWNDDKYYAVVGTIANSTVRATIKNRSWGNMEYGGYQEARHQAIFGKNGSGKSVWVLTLVAAKLAAHPQMGLLIPDTQGDFEDPNKHSRGDFKWNYQEVLAAAGVQVETIKIENIALKSKESLKDLLKPCLLKVYSMDGEKASTLAGLVVESMYDKDVDDTTILTPERIGDEVVSQIGWVYARGSRASKVEDAQNVLTNQGRFRILRDQIKKHVLPLFTGNIDIRDLVKDVLIGHRKVVIAMHTLPESQQMYVMQEIMRYIRRRAQEFYRNNKEDVGVNTIIVIDEAPRWVPQGEGSEIKETILRALRETRKARIGWWVVGQSPADVDKTVLKQAHMTWFGRGLGIGADATHLETVLGKDNLHIYQEMQRRPGKFFWVGIGSENNLGNESTPVTIEPFDGDAGQKLIDANPHIWRKQEPKL